MKICVTGGCGFIGAALTERLLGVGAGGTYLIGDEECFPIEEVVKRVGKSIGAGVSIPHFPIIPLIIAGHIYEKACKPFGIEPLIFPRRVDWFRQARAFKIDKAKRELGYVPKIGINEGLKRTGEWYIENGYIRRNNTAYVTQTAFV